MSAPAPLAARAVTVARTDRLGGVASVWSFVARTADGARVPGPCLAVIGAQHGNERVGIDVVERLLTRATTHLRCGELRLVLANLDGMAIDRRHTPDGVDMNRLWDRATLDRLSAADPASLCSEERRVRELAPLLLACDAVLDLHSTSRPSPPHLILRDDRAHARVAARLGVPRVVTGVFENRVLSGGILADLGLTPGDRGTRLGFTLEAGQHGNPANLDAAWQVTLRWLDALDVWSHDDELVPADGGFDVYDILYRVRQTAPGWRFAGYDGTPAGPRHGPARELASFEEIEADEVVLRRGGEVWRAPGPFTLLMPAPTAGAGEDLFFVTQRRHRALGVTDDPHVAVAQAHAIEAVLDQLASDESSRGVVQVTFDPGRALDLAVELVARTTRLPEASPHRRLVLLGRGASGASDDGVHLASARWDSAVADAVSAGVPVQRVQLLAGTPLGWLARVAGGAVAQEVVVSTTRALAVSLVIAGDLALALESGDLRHVGVALLVEGPSVTPAGDDVSVHVARAAVAGARPALLRVGAALLSSALAEGVAAPAPEVLVGAQVARWREVLAPLVTRRQVVPRGGLGAWLAQIMSATGIRDADALRSWLVEPSDGGWVVAPERLVGGAPTSAPWPTASLSVPVRAADVDADTLERWVGWKRTQRDTQSIPGDRGRDVHLSFDESTLRRVVTRWLTQAVADGADAPGAWLVATTGDGPSPDRDGDPDGLALVAAHRAVVRAPALRVLRVQHAPGTSLPWWRSLVDDVIARTSSAGAVPVGLVSDVEHGAGLSVVLIGRRSTPDATVGAWSLEPWDVVRALVIVTDPRHRAAFGLWTDVDEAPGVNAELVHFARGHVSRLIAETSSKLSVSAGPLARVGLEQLSVRLVVDRLSRLRAARDVLAELAPEHRVAWMRVRAGVRDEAVAAALVEAALSDAGLDAAARALWTTESPWPGSG